MDQAPREITRTAATGKAGRRKLYIRPDVFARLQVVQREQAGSPRFDLADLASAALTVLLAMPEAGKLIERQARIDFVERQSRSIEELG